MAADCFYINTDRFVFDACFQIQLLQVQAQTTMHPRQASESAVTLFGSLRVAQRVLELKVLLGQHLVDSVHGFFGTEHQLVHFVRVGDVLVQLELGAHGVAELVRPDVAFWVLPVEPQHELVEHAVAWG